MADLCIDLGPLVAEAVKKVYAELIEDASGEDIAKLLLRVFSEKMRLERRVGQLERALGIYADQSNWIREEILDLAEPVDADATSLPTHKTLNERYHIQLRHDIGASGPGWMQRSGLIQAGLGPAVDFGQVARKALEGSSPKVAEERTRARRVRELLARAHEVTQQAGLDCLPLEQAIREMSDED